MNCTKSLMSFIVLLLFLTIPASIFAQEDTEEDPELVDLIYKYGVKGYENLVLNKNLDTAEFYLQKAIDLQYSTRNYKIDDRVARYLVALASVYRRIYSNTEALKILNEAERIMQYDKSHLLFAYIYHNKGNIYKLKNDIYRTKEYYSYALDFLIKNGYQNTTDFAHVFSNYINLLFEIEEYDQAEEQLSIIDINSLNVSPMIEFRIHITNATTYSRLLNYELTEYHFRKARQILEEQQENDEFNSHIIIYFYHKIDFHIQWEEYNQALIECDRAFTFIESLDPHATRNKTIYNSNIVYRTATIQYRNDQLDRALMLANRGISNLTEFFNELSFGDESLSIRNEYTSRLPELQILKSRILFDQFILLSSIEKLKSSYSAYHKAIETLNYMKIAMHDEDSRVFATGQVLEVYNEAIYVGKLLYDMTGDREYLEKSFEFAESSKSFALYSEIKDMEAMEFSDLPAEVKQREQRYIGELQAYEELLYAEQLSSEPDTALMEDYKDIIFHLKDDKDNLMQEIEMNNSKYYEIKYNPKFVKLEEVRNQLPFRDALIEYVLTDTMLITYVIDRKGINVLSQEIDPEFEKECLEYYELLHKQNFSSGVHENYKRFVTLGRKFFRILIEPCLEYTDKKNFTIVPDGAITYLPFEGLLTEDTDTEYINYMVLPYMIRKYSVGYSHSSTLMFSERLKTKSPERKVLAFAPKYFDPYENTTVEAIRQSVPESGVLMPLGGIIKEVQSINETVPSRVFLNEQATEASFKKYASDYNVLHLAMHTIMRDDEPLYSHLAFTNVETGDTIEDNKLFAYEIYNMKLNAQMAVLSACASGVGKMQKGEGMMSLARGFIYAGCPSIIMTLWQVADQSSSDLMTSFYRYLKKGKSKQEAMRLAKIDYLEMADDLTSNPYFWSGFVVVGDSSPVYRKSGVAYWMIIITIFIGAMIFIQYRRS